MATMTQKQIIVEFFDSRISNRLGLEDCTTLTLESIAHYGRREHNIIHSGGSYVRVFKDMRFNNEFKENGLKLIEIHSRPFYKFKMEQVRK